MLNNDQLYNHLATWKEHAPFLGGEHLDEEALYHLAGSGSMVNADPVALQHLSLCPVCIEAWANWCHARGAAQVTEDNASDIEFTFGYLQAAASPVLTDGVSMQSQCGSYRLDLLPQKEAQGRGLVVFEALSETEPVEDALVTIHDRNGLLLLKGRLCEGRLARPVDNPGQFDLSTWTVAIDTTQADLP